MSMTEQEIRADERDNMVVRLRAASMTCTDGPVKAGIERAIFDILWDVPKAEPEPVIPAHAKSPRAVPLGGCVQMPTDYWPGGPEEQPRKDWRDVPVTAGMIVDRFLPRAFDPQGIRPEWVEGLEFAAKRKVDGEATLAEAERKGWP